MNRRLNRICGEYTLPQQFKAQGIYPYYTPIESEQSTVVKIDGRDVLMFGSNSYLGLSNDPRLKEAAKAAIDKYGTSWQGRCCDLQYRNAGESWCRIMLEHQRKLRASGFPRPCFDN